MIRFTAFIYPWTHSRWWYVIWNRFRHMVPIAIGYFMARHTFNNENLVFMIITLDQLNMSTHTRTPCTVYLCNFASHITLSLWKCGLKMHSIKIRCDRNNCFICLPVCKHSSLKHCQRCWHFSSGFNTHIWAALCLCVKLTSKRANTNLKSMQLRRLL